MFVFVMAMVGQPATESLALRCTGPALSMATTSVSTATAMDNNGNAATGSSSTAVPVQIEMVVEFRMANGAATIRLPASAYGEGNIRGPRLEEKVERLQVTDSEITGTIRKDIFSKTQFRIDRVTGEMTSRGGYRGQCVPIDLVKRAF